MVRGRTGHAELEDDVAAVVCDTQGADRVRAENGPLSRHVGRGLARERERTVDLVEELAAGEVAGLTQARLAFDLRPAVDPDGALLVGERAPAGEIGRASGGERGSV